MSSICFNLLFSFLFIPFVSCNTWQNHGGMSNNLEESKKRGVFICEYEAKRNRIKINDTLFFNIKNAWLEKRWKYPEKWDETHVLEGYQLIIETDNVIPKGFDETWTIGVDFKRYIRTCGKKCLMTDFDSLPTASKEVWKVRTGWGLKPEAEKKILGNFVLYKKE